MTLYSGVQRDTMENSGSVQWDLQYDTDIIKLMSDNDSRFSGISADFECSSEYLCISLW